MKIMYVHGFGSSFDPTSDKIVTLSQLGEVVGMSYDYTANPHQIKMTLIEFALDNVVDLVVGTSLGGYFAAEVGMVVGVPVVMINPAVNPRETLRKYLGENVDHYGNSYTLTEDTLSGYSFIAVSPVCGLVLLDEGDEVINAFDIATVLADHFHIVRFPGGSHRFEHMAESLDHISAHFDAAEMIYE